MGTHDLVEFIRESNMIEGITREPSSAEINAHQVFLARRTITWQALEHFVSLVAGVVIRDRLGMDVRVGPHFPLPGGPAVVLKLNTILAHAFVEGACPWRIHNEYETLHPFMDGNGRSGRVLWLWMMERAGLINPIEPLSFLHHFYYQTLQGVRL